MVVVSGLIIYNSMEVGFAVAKTMAPQFGVSAMVASVVVVPLVSLVTKKFDARHIEKCFSK